MKLPPLCTALSLFLLLQWIHTDGNALSIELIHKDSPESPLYPGNLTAHQSFHRLHHQTDARLRYLAVASASAALTNHTGEEHHESHGVIRPPIVFDGSHYLIKVGIGSFHGMDILRHSDHHSDDHHSDHHSKSKYNTEYMTYYLTADTGSDLIWTQCQGCQSCFPQAEPLYPSSESRTFKYLSCMQDSFCSRQCDGGDGKCRYTQRYVGGQSTTGLLARDHFTFDSKDGETVTVDNIVFGCGENQQNFYYKQGSTRVAGIAGLGTGPGSLVRQLGSHAKGIFSYCIPYKRNAQYASNLVLRFGEDAKFLPETRVATTRLVAGPLPTYYVELFGMTFGERRLEIPNEEFGRGCVLDGGSPLTSIPISTFERLKEVVTMYFEERNMKRVSVRDTELLCYLVPRDSYEFTLPQMVFHLRDADMVVRAGAYLFLKEYFCLAVKPHQYEQISVIIGNYAQSDKRFVYDLTSSTVSFAEQDCNMNA